MDISELIAAILNPGGRNSAGGMPMMAADLGAGTPQPGYPMQPPQMQAAQPSQMQPGAPRQPTQQGLGQALGGILEGIIAPQSAARNKTVGWLTQQGLDQGTATLLASDKPALQSYLLQRTKGQGPTEFDQRAAAAQQYGLDPSTPEGRSFILTGKVGGDGSDLTSDMKEYRAAVEQGFTGTLMDFMVKMKEAGRNQVNIDTGAKLPTGYMWIDPNNQDLGVKPIANGPATQIPAEAAGRIGLADSFLANFDDVRKKVAAGEITGPIDRARAANDSSYSGAETYRQIKTGVDSLQRMLTGAGMPASEAEAYAYRYLPTYTDDATSMTTKLDRLKAELLSIQKRVLQGRGGEQPSQPANEGGWTDLGNGVRIRQK